MFSLMSVCGPYLWCWSDCVVVRKAYYKLSLKVHPDRVPAGELEQATRKFQALGKIYEVLSDDERRAVYDEDGKQQPRDRDVKCTSWLK